MKKNVVNVTQTWYGPVELFFFFTPDKLIVKHFDVCVTKSYIGGLCLLLL